MLLFSPNLMSCHFLLGDLLKIASCEFCGENFKKTQSLASHARSHLRQLGVTDWTAHGSPMATLRELMARRSSSSLPQSMQTLPLMPTLSKPPLEALPTSTPGPSPFLLHKPPSEAPPTSVRVPKARKGSRMVVSKPKDEPVEMDISEQSTKSTPPSPTKFNFSAVHSAAEHTTVPANQKESAGKCWVFIYMTLASVHVPL